MYWNPNELLLLTRVGREPRATHPADVPLPKRQRREGPGRWVTASRRLRIRPAPRPALDTHEYLRLEFAVDDEPQPTRR